MKCLLILGTVLNLSSQRIYPHKDRDCYSSELMRLQGFSFSFFFLLTEHSPAICIYFIYLNAFELIIVNILLSWGITVHNCNSNCAGSSEAVRQDADFIP